VTTADRVARHERACAGFSRVVDAAGGRWDSPSPCTEWDARGVVEHVIGFHEVLMLRPLSVKAHRPHEGTEARWSATRDAIFTALAGDVPDDIRGLLPALTTEVLVHTWDLARAVGGDDRLDAELCEQAWAALPEDRSLRDSGMFGAAVPVADDAPVQERLVAFYGRDPRWRARGA